MKDISQSCRGVVCPEAEDAVECRVLTTRNVTLSMCACGGVSSVQSLKCNDASLVLRCHTVVWLCGRACSVFSHVSVFLALDQKNTTNTSAINSPS